MVALYRPFAASRTSGALLASSRNTIYCSSQPLVSGRQINDEFVRKKTAFGGGWRIYNARASTSRRIWAFLASASRPDKIRSVPMNAPIIAQRKGFYYEVKAGKRYLWCSCGRSKSQPFCDGSHQGTEFLPVAFKAERDEDVIFCGCKHTPALPREGKASQESSEAGNPRDIAVHHVRVETA